MDEVLAWTLRFGAGLLILAVFWFAAALGQKLALRTVALDPARRDALEYVVIVLKWGAVALGLLTALGTVGVDVSALVAGLGLTGLTIGFALKDVASSLMAGLLLIIYRPFRRGDRIAVLGLEGMVVAIDLRYTHLQAEGRRFLVPNSAVLTNPVTVMGGES